MGDFKGGVILKKYEFNARFVSSFTQLYLNRRILNQCLILGDQFSGRQTVHL